ncbi:MAG TPA: phospholipase D-like domain-containing protein [Xanthobacteraceae bacterium]|nr:phospholipase D-like domain-containing protein [Xanthobacteraceae bacterium]
MSIVDPGRNAWRVEKATRLTVLIDGCNYYSQLENSLKLATRSITIVGWDFDGSIRLCPHHEDCSPLGDFLRELVDAKPGLMVRILVWSGALVHTPGATVPLLWGDKWEQCDRIVVKLDREHPLHASHHQKIVVIDDSLAFVGGMDLTVRRWDTCAHEETNEFRCHPDGTPHNPIHDVQMLVSGPAAAALGDLTRERWRIATGEELTASPPREMWIDGLGEDFRDVSVAIARTAPARNGRPAIEEVAELTADLLLAARRYIYIEAQYFTARIVRRVLAQSLAGREGPDIVVIATRAPHGHVERLIMNKNRDRLLRYLRRADKHNRLRMFYPVVAGTRSVCDLQIHSKVVIADDRWLRVGSANLNNRSMALDTECDVLLEATSDTERSAIASIRDRLVGEHLGAEAQLVSEAVRSERSLIRAIEELNGSGRGLRPFPELDLEGPVRPVVGTDILDPGPASRIV